MIYDKMLTKYNEIITQTNENMSNRSRNTILSESTEAIPKTSPEGIGGGVGV
jgi:hypothetical protein